MKLWKWTLGLLVVGFLVMDAFGATVSKIVTCYDVQGRQPQGETQEFNGVKKAYCFVQVKGAKGESVKLVWTYGGHGVQLETSFKVGTDNWRGYGTKNIEGLDGKWQVKLIDATGKSLGETTFTVK